MMDSRVDTIDQFVDSVPAVAIVTPDADTRSIRAVQTDVANDLWRTARLFRDEWRRHRYARLSAG